MFTASWKNEVPLTHTMIMVMGTKGLGSPTQGIHASLILPVYSREKLEMHHSTLDLLIGHNRVGTAEVFAQDLINSSVRGLLPL